MKLSPRTAALPAALAILVAGYAAVVRPAETSIAQRGAAIDDARAVLARRADTARRARRLQADRSSLELTLGDDGVRERPSAIVARFLRTVARVAVADDVRVTAVATVDVPRVAPAPPVAPAPSVTSPPVPAFDDIALRVALAGSYPALLRAVRDVASRPPAATVVVASLGGVERAGVASPRLHALLDVTLHHLHEGPVR